ncbi:unnamed protein product [Urochloa humidicola]
MERGNGAISQGGIVSNITRNDTMKVDKKQVMSSCQMVLVCKEHNEIMLFDVLFVIRSSVKSCKGCLRSGCPFGLWPNNSPGN